ncbi:MAG: glycoside hydrolase family 31 protein [Acidobacteriota bacterium]|nr:glycoside hydrolase family 31 protein [Acidobacteriota bacterium]
MSSKWNRRQFGKRVLTGAVLTLAAGRDATAGIACTAENCRPLPWTAVAPGIWKATLGTPEAITPVTSRLKPVAADALQRMPQVAAPPLPGPLGAVTQRGSVLTLALAAEEQLYGFGLQFQGMAHRGRKRTLRVNADPGNDSGDSHAPVPFYVSNRGYGVFVDTARYATFYCGDARPKPVQPTHQDAGGVVPLYVGALGDADSSRVVVEVPRASGVEVYLFAGPAMVQAVQRYNLFSGGGVRPPEWGLGFWYRAASNAHDHEIAALAEEFRERRIPCDVIGLEAGWHTHAYSCTYAWHKERFPQPGTFLRGLAAQNYHVNLWEHAFVHPSSPLFAPMQPHSGDAGVWGGLVPDFESAAARGVFGDYHGKALIDEGVSGFKLDECDNSDFTGGWSFPELTQFGSGVDGEQMHSLFGLRYQAALLQQFEQRGQATYSLVRSSGALAAPYPFVLYSDLYDHRQFVRALVNASFSGLLWCPEVRDARSEEDLIRRLQTVVFAPLAMVNGWYIPNPPWKQLNRQKNNANKLAPGWESLEERCREILGWRMQLIPYLQAAFARYAEDGTPPFRAVPLDWPDVPALAKVDDAWMVGDRMLVAPLFAGEPAGRSLTLPPGTWHDLWTGVAHAGGTTLDLPAETRNIPVFVKSDCVLPLAATTNSTADAARRALTVRVFGSGSLPFVLHTSTGALTLRWNAAQQRGSVEQRGDAEYHVVAWQ